MNNDLIDLREKYVRMRALRLERAHAAPDREALRELSRRWPGALAEIDRLADATITARLAALDAAIAGAEPPLWARAWILAHRRLRGALAIKAKLAGLCDELPAEAELYSARLDEIRKPPNGKLTDLVFADVARELRLPEDDMRQLLLPRDAMH